MSEPFALLEARLKAGGQSITVTRRVVFDALQNAEPLSMRELALRCANIDRSSVYRTVQLFEKLGIVQRLQIGWKYKLELSGEFIHHHHHLSCTRCGTIIPLAEDAAIERQLEQLAAQHGFTASDHQLEIRGLCAACSRK